MTTLDRRRFAAAAGATLLAPATSAVAQTASYKLLLNTSLSGPVAFFLLADDRGYFRDAGMQVAFSPGGGAAVIVPQVKSPDFDIGYGDITALIERIARGAPNEGPVAVYTTFNTVPFTIAVAADGPIKVPKDFEGRAISGHPIDAALVTFDMFARATGIDIGKVKVIRSDAAMGNQVADMLKGAEWQGVFGFVNTIIASVAPLGIDGRKQLRFLDYADHLPDMYGNALFVTRELYRRGAPVLGPLVRAVNRGLVDTVKEPGAAIDALVKRAPSANRDVNHTRLVGTLRSEMAHPEGRRIGVGDMDDARLERLIKLIVDAKKLPRLPAVREVFDRSFLPPDEERIRSLAR